MGSSHGAGVTEGASGDLWGRGQVEDREPALTTYHRCVSRAVNAVSFILRVTVGWITLSAQSDLGAEPRTQGHSDAKIQIWGLNSFLSGSQVLVCSVMR